MCDRCGPVRCPGHTCHAETYQTSATPVRATAGRTEESSPRTDESALAAAQGVDLRLLGYFAILAEELHFRRAAERLRIAQPPLTRAIKSLEARLGLELFDRAPNGVRLTRAGEILLEHSRELLAVHRSLVDRMEVLKHDASERPRLGFAGAAAGLWPAAIVRQLRLSHPPSIIYVQGNAYNDSICVGLATGVAGSYYAAPFYSDCDAYSSGGQASASHGPGCCYHGTAIYAGPASAKTILSPTHYSY